MKETLRENRTYFLLQLLFIAVGGFAFLIYVQGAETLWMSDHHMPAMDLFFKYATMLGEWPGITAGALLLLFYKEKMASLVYALALILNGILTGMLKFYCFPLVVRPSQFFPAHIKLNFVDGMEILRQYSFPSGHTSTAFAMMLVLCMYFTKSCQRLLFFGLAVLVALSRVYLLQHFYRDVYAGAILGSVVALLVFTAVKNWVPNHRQK
ncbi:MAG: phosphatase PAP2 family protein [Chitinophagales bacterium]